MYNLTRYEEASDKPKLGNILLNMALLAESEEELKGLLMKEESEKLAENSMFIKLKSWHLVPSLHGK